MKKVEGVVVVVYKKSDGSTRYAVLKRELNWEGWELVKGKVEDGEDLEKTAKREVKEETGIEANEIVSLDDIHEWEYQRNGEKHKAEYHAFLAEVPEDSYIDVDANKVEEHSKGFFLNLRDSKGMLTHDNQKELLEEASEIIEERG